MQLSTCGNVAPVVKEFFLNKNLAKALLQGQSGAIGIENLGGAKFAKVLCVRVGYFFVLGIGLCYI